MNQDIITLEVSMDFLIITRLMARLMASSLSLLAFHRIETDQVSLKAVRLDIRPNLISFNLT